MPMKSLSRRTAFVRQYAVDYTQVSSNVWAKVGQHDDTTLSELTLQETS